MVSASLGLLHIADCLLTHICHDFPIPPNMTQDLVDRVISEVEFWWYTMMSYPSPQKYAKVGIGFLIAEMWKVRLLCTLCCWCLAAQSRRTISPSRKQVLISQRISLGHQACYRFLCLAKAWNGNTSKCSSSSDTRVQSGLDEELMGLGLCVLIPLGSFAH